MQEELFKPSPKPWQPHGFQKKGVKFLLEHACAALFLDPGMGKTSMTYAAFKVLKAKKVARKMLVVAPLRPCYLVWPKERDKWVDFNGFKIQVLHEGGKDALWDDFDIGIINPEGLDWLLGVEKSKTPGGKTRVAVDGRRVRRLGFDTLVVDELTQFKHTNTNRYKSLKQVLHLFARRWGLTGDPAPNGLMDLFGQCYVLDMGRTFGPYITHFRNEYFTPSWDGYSWVLKQGADKLIYDRIRPLALRMAAEDYLELPELIENNIMVELPPAVQKIYNTLEAAFIAKWDGGLVTAANAAAASTKCRQIANGGVYLDPELTGLVGDSDRKWKNLHTEKVDALADLITELQGDPLLVAYDFEHDLDRLRQKLGQDVPYIGGGVSAKRSVELEQLWNAGKLPVLLGHPQSIARGLNLQEVGKHVCWHSMTWDYELYDQFIRRILRQGNKAKRVMNHHIMAKDTIDLVMLASLKSKKKGQQALFDALTDYMGRRK